MVESGFLLFTVHHRPFGNYLRYFLMMASSFFVVASGHNSCGVKMAFLSAEPHSQARSVRPRLLTASRMMTCALRTFLLRYSTTASTVTASCPSCQQS